jgi:hypothetical protein
MSESALRGCDRPGGVRHRLLCAAMPGRSHPRKADSDMGSPHLLRLFPTPNLRADRTVVVLRPTKMCVVVKSGREVLGASPHMPVLHFAPGIHHDKLFCGSQDHAHSIRTAILGWAAPWMGRGGGASQRPCPAPARGPGCSARSAAIQASSRRRTCVPTRRRRKRGPTQRHRQLWTDISPRGQATAVRGGALFRGPGETNRQATAATGTTSTACCRRCWC